MSILGHNDDYLNVFFDYLSLTIDTIISNHSLSEVIVLVNINVHNKASLGYSKNHPQKRTTQIFAINNDLNNIICKRTFSVYQPLIMDI